MARAQATPRFVPAVGQYVIYHDPRLVTGLSVAKADRVLPKTVVEHLAHRDRSIPMDRIMGCFDDYDRAVDVMVAVRKAHAEEGPVAARRVLKEALAEPSSQMYEPLLSLIHI